MSAPKILLIAIVLLVVAAGWQMAQYLALPQSIQQQVSRSDSFSGLLGMNTSVPQSSDLVDWKIETVAENLQVPWSIVFPNEQSLLFTERPGRIRSIIAGNVQEDPVYTFQDVRVSQEQGLMGLALHPEYDQNGFVYTCVSLPEGESYFVKVLRLKATNPTEPTSLQFDREVITGIAGARNHAGCALTFGPDEKLYISTGDALQRDQAKDPKVLNGKILRLNEDGSIPSDNPFPNSPVYSTGHRNPQGLAWHPNGSLYSTEHGPSVFDGPAGGDELNRILAGEYYGWPEVSHERTLSGAQSPLAVYTPAEAPASLLAYTGTHLPQFTDDLFFGALRGEGLWRVQIDPQDPTKILSQEKLFSGEYGRIRAVVQGLDGCIYFSTSNQDGRGRPAGTDDRILRICAEQM